MKSNSKKNITVGSYKLSNFDRLSYTTTVSSSSSNSINICTNLNSQTEENIDKWNLIFDILFDEQIMWFNKIIKLNKIIYKPKWGHLSSKEELLSFIFKIQDIYKKCYKHNQVLYYDYANKINQLDNCIHKITL